MRTRCRSRIVGIVLRSQSAEARGAEPVRRTQMNKIEWYGEKEFSVDGVRFLCAVDDHSSKTNDERVIILKDRTVLENYADVFLSTQPKTVLEFGIFQGGSPTLF